MAFNMKRTASELLKIADAIEKEASEKTYFVCDECNHTASMASINRVRSKVASANGIENVSFITVNDNISCPVIDCEGKMHYAATDESDKYYIDVEAGKEEDSFDLEGENSLEDSPEEIAPDTTDKEDESTNEDESNFEPVDEQVGESEPASIPLEDEPIVPSEEDIKDEEDKEEPKKSPKPKKKKDKADDEKAVPKFTEMPEDMKDLKMKAASDRFYQSVARYSNM